MAAQVFISYRRDDEPYSAVALFQKLEAEFGPKAIFFDIEGDIRAGDDFVATIQEHVSACYVMLVVIGPKWIYAKDEYGQFRLENPADFVRVELASALELGKLVIPVLVGGAPMPAEAQLPPILRSLARRQGVRLSHDRFNADCQGMVKEVRGIIDAAIGSAQEHETGNNLLRSEAEAWAAASRRDSAAVYEEFLRSWPSGAHSAQARSRLHVITSISAPPPPPVTLNVYSHSSFFYWWYIWLYSFICAGITLTFGQKMHVTVYGDSYLFYGHAWLGMSFMILILFIVVVTNVKIGLIEAMLLASSIVLSILALSILNVLQTLMDLASTIPAPFMNFNFYLLFGIIVGISWAYITFVNDRRTYWRVSSGSIAMISFRKTVIFGEYGVNISNSSEEVFLNHILGLSFLGIGTGDIFITVESGDTYTLKNVWRADAVCRQIDRIISE